MPNYIKGIKVGNQTYSVASEYISYPTGAQTPTVATVTVKPLTLTSVSGGVTSTATYNIIVAG